MSQLSAQRRAKIASLSRDEREAYLDAFAKFDQAGDLLAQACLQLQMLNEPRSCGVLWSMMFCQVADSLGIGNNGVGRLDAMMRVLLEAGLTLVALPQEGEDG